MNYRTIDHHKLPLTAKYIGYLYDLSNPANSDCGYCCLPKGTICISISIQGHFSILKAGTWEKQAPVSVFGLIKKPQFLLMSPRFREITIGFYPHVFQQFLKDSMSGLSDQVITDLSLLVNKYAVEELFDALCVAPSDLQLLQAIEQFLARHLDSKKKDARLNHAHHLIVDSDINSVASLSDALNLSSARLRELFRDKVGFTPKETIRIARIKKALERTIDSEERLTNLAYDLQYFDQSHFIHDFRSLTGLTPSQYYKNPQLTSDFYNYSRLQFSSFAS